MSAYRDLTINVHAGVLAWLESEARIINADLQALGKPADVTAADVAMVLLERGIAGAVARQSQHVVPKERKQVAPKLLERVVGQMV